jgi:Ni/Co efflux regulator RcnB
MVFSAVKRKPWNKTGGPGVPTGRKDSIMKKSLLTIALFLLAVAQLPAQAQSMGAREDSSNTTANSTGKTDQSAHNDKKDKAKARKKDKAAPAGNREKTGKPAPEQEKPYDPTLGIWG